MEEKQKPGVDSKTYPPKDGKNIKKEAKKSKELNKEETLEIFISSLKNMSTLFPGIQLYNSLDKTLVSINIPGIQITDDKRIVLASKVDEHLSN